MIPGSNLLSSAFTVIAQQDFVWHKFSSSATNAIGIEVPTYDAPVNLRGSVQAVPSNLYKHMGLDWKKKHIMIYCSTPIVGPDRDYSGDRVEYSGIFYQALDNTSWQAQDGWSGVVFAESPQ